LPSPGSTLPSAILRSSFSSISGRPGKRAPALVQEIEAVLTEGLAGTRRIPVRAHRQGA
jgi:hypothetical protein